MTQIDAVVFDLGKVLLDWNPAYFFRKHFADDDGSALERFLGEVVSPAWIAEMDAGKPAATAIAELCARHPSHAPLISLWHEGWPTMLRGEISGTVAILAELRDRTRLYALTNFSTETYPVACARFPFLTWFEDVIVSGEVGLVKPDRRIFELAIERCRLDAGRSLFIDDMAANVDAARSCGMHALQFTTPEALRTSLQTWGLLGG